MELFISTVFAIISYHVVGEFFPDNANAPFAIRRVWVFSTVLKVSGFQQFNPNQSIFIMGLAFNSLLDAFFPCMPN